jgi:spermidine synthase
MRLSQPQQLVLDYTQDMMAWLMLLAAPSRLLQLGLGAGSCTRFIAHYLPTTRQTIVELHQEVILANAIMFGTKPGPSLEFVCDDASRFLRDSKPSLWPLILVDLYDAEATGPACDGPTFYRRCYRALKAPGVMVLNLFGSHPSWVPNVQALCDAFERQPLMLSPSKAGNVIVIASKGPALCWPETQKSRELDAFLNDRAKLLKSSLTLPAQRWLGPIRAYLEKTGLHGQTEKLPCYR